MTIMPPSRPQQSLDRTLQLLRSAGVSTPTALLGIRGYYRDTMGKPGVNDRGVYDDAIILVERNVQLTFNANTDPSVYRPGIAVLKPGLWSYQIGLHGLNKPESLRYTALVQAAPVTVVRDGKGEDSGWFGINIHRGGENGTGSLGCQIIVPAQWPTFIFAVRRAMSAANQEEIPYLLIEAA